MEKNKHLPVSNQSLWTRTLICFMVMALSMITLLWAVQEWFFSTQYTSLKQKEIVKVLNNATDDYLSTLPPSFFKHLHKVAIDNNMVIYFFSYKKPSALDSGIQEFTKDGKTYYKLVGEFNTEYELSAANSEETIYKSSSSAINDLSWTIEQESRFIKLLGLNESFYPRKKPAWHYDAAAQRIYYASEAKEFVYDNKTTHFYFYAEAVMSESEVTVELIKFAFILLTVIILVLSLVFSVLLSSVLSRPITKISRQAESFASGNLDTTFEFSNIKEINNLASTLNYAVEEISKTEQLRREFIANISHDLRTPLTMVKAYAEMIRDISGENPKKRNEHAQVIIDEADRLSSLVEDIQKLSKIQAGTDAIELVSFDLDEFCKATVRQFGIMHEKFGYNLIFESGGESIVLADKDKISQVLYNLIGNALTYTNKENKIVKVRQYRQGKKAIVEVEDNGKGIAPEDIDAVWDRYYRVNQEKRSVVGSGLGLSIVKSILEAHKAEYGIKSELGKGSIFWFALPLDKPTKHQPKQSQETLD